MSENKADIVVRLQDWRNLHLTRLGALFEEAAAHIEALRREVRTQRAEIAQHVNLRNAILDMDNPPNHKKDW